jgi:drug/metabolite transporter (DMT)-like permease
MDSKHPRLALIVAALLFSTGGVCIKQLAGLTAWQRGGLRSAIAALFLLMVWKRARSGYTWKSLVFSFFYAGTLATFVAANTYTTSANAIFLQSTAPLYVLLLSPIVLRESVKASDLLYMGALAVGLALCFGDEVGSGASTAQATAPRPMLGNAFGLVSGILWACTIVGLRWFGQRSRDGGEDSGGAGASVVLGNITCFAVCALLAQATGDGLFHGVASLPPKSYILVFLGVFQVGLAYICITRGMSRVPAMEASLLPGRADLQSGLVVPRAAREAGAVVARGGA